MWIVLLRNGSANRMRFRGHVIEEPPNHDSRYLFMKEISPILLPKIMTDDRLSGGNTRKKYLDRRKKKNVPVTKESRALLRQSVQQYQSAPICFSAARRDESCPHIRTLLKNFRMAEPAESAQSLALDALNSRRFTLAAEIYEKFISQHGPNFKTYILLADAYAKGERLQEAVEAYSTAFRLDSNPSIGLR